MCKLCKSIKTILRSLLMHKVAYDVHRQRENDGGVLLGCDGAQSLKVSQLKARWRFWDHQRRLLQSPGCVHLSLCCDHLLSSIKSNIYILSNTIAELNMQVEIRYCLCILLSDAHLCSGFTGCFCLCGHGSLQLVWQFDIFNLHSLHLNTPRVCGLI